MMKSHLWNLWGRTFVINGSTTHSGRGIVLGEMEYTVHLQKDGEWVAVKEDVATGVLLSFLRRFDPKAKGALLEGLPSFVRNGISRMSSQFGRARDAEADAFAVVVLCSQQTGLVESGSLREI